MDIELYINENYIELAPESSIALTLQINNLNNLQNRQGFFSNTLKAPLTKTNVASLEYISNVNSGSNVPYEKNMAKIVQGGIEIVNDGVAVVSTVDGFFNINVYSGNLDFFTLIGSSLISALDWGSPSDIGEWNYDNIIASQSNTSEFIYGLVDWGNESNAISNGLNVNSNVLYPLFFIHTLMSMIAAAQDYTFEGSLIDSDQFSNLLLSPGSWGHTSDFITQHTASSTQVGDALADSFLITEDVPAPIPIKTNAYQGSEVSNTYMFYNPDQDITATLEVNISVTFSRAGGMDDYSYNFQIYNVTTATVVYSDPAVVLTSPGSLSVTDTLILSNYRFIGGQQYEARLLFSNGVFSDVVFFVWHSGTNMTITPTATIGINDTVYPSDVLPEMKQIDLIKGICNMTSSVFTTDSIRKIVSFNFLDDIIANIGNAIDWTNKIHLGNKPVLNFRNNNYGQSNLFKYKEDDSVTLGYGDGDILVSDENLDAEKTQVVLPFAASEHYINLNGYPVPKIKFRNSVSDYESLTARILMLDSTLGTMITLSDVNNPATVTNYTNTPYCYFINNDKDDSLGFDQDLIDNYYQFVSGILNQYKEIDAFFKLTELDIANINFLYPIYLDINTPDVQLNGYFYINRIENYKGKWFTKVKLIRL